MSTGQMGNFIFCPVIYSIARCHDSMSPPWYRCWLIIRYFVIVQSCKARLSNEKQGTDFARLQLQSSWTNLNVLDGRNQYSIFSLFTSVFVCASRSLVTPRSHKPSLTVVSMAPIHGAVASLQRPQVLAVTSQYQTRKTAGNMHWTCSYSLCGEIRALDIQQLAQP